MRIIQYLQTLSVFILLTLCVPIQLQAIELSELLGQEDMDKLDRQQTIERIENIQEKLKLLQNKLKALEKRKTVNRKPHEEMSVAEPGPSSGSTTTWTPLYEDTLQDHTGIQTYLLFSGDENDENALGLLEDFILTIETLPELATTQVSTNRFFVPVEKPQSVINLGRQPYSYQLNRIFMDYLQLSAMRLPQGPVLVSSAKPIDPITGEVTDSFIALAVGRQAPERTASIALKLHELSDMGQATTEEQTTSMLWEIIDQLGPVQIMRDNQHVTIIMPQ